MARALALLPVLLLTLSACDSLGGGDEPTPGRCSGPHDGSELDGDWTLTARGERHDCDDPSFEGALEIELAMPIAIIATPRGADADGGGAGDDDYTLALAAGQPDELALEGVSRGACVSFTLREQLAGDDELQYDFDGVITGEGLVEGDFAGLGPSGCRADGTFVVEAR